jgi:hypothetical protein
MAPMSSRLWNPLNGKKRLTKRNVNSFKYGWRCCDETPWWTPFSKVKVPDEVDRRQVLLRDVMVAALRDLSKKVALFRELDLPLPVINYNLRARLHRVNHEALQWLRRAIGSDVDTQPPCVEAIHDAEVPLRGSLSPSFSLRLRFSIAPTTSPHFAAFKQGPLVWSPKPAIDNTGLSAALIK